MKKPVMEFNGWLEVFVAASGIGAMFKVVFLYFGLGEGVSSLIGLFMTCVAPFMYRKRTP